MSIARSEDMKSAFVLQHAQPLVSSHTLSSISFSSVISDLFFNISPSMFTSPNSFSNMTYSLPVLLTISLINVVLPAPRKPEITSIFMFFISPSYKNYNIFIHNCIKESCLYIKKYFLSIIYKLFIHIF